MSKFVKCVKFGASWCQPCRVLTPIFHRVSEMEDFKDIEFYDLDIDDPNNAELVRNYQIRNVPTTLCLDKNNEEAAVLESLTQGEEEVSLFMNFQTVEDYAAFNEVLLFAGTYAEAASAGYLPEELYDAEGEAADTESEKLDDLKVIVTEESVCIQTAGKIKYVSDNVSIVDKKLARALEAGKGHPAFVLYK